MAKMRQGIKLPTKLQIAYVVTAICQPGCASCPPAVIETMPRIPTLWDFKQRLEAEGREGSIVAASFMDAPRQRNDRDTNQRIKKGERPVEFDTHPAMGRQKDSEARWTEKNNEAHYGWKNHVKADLKTKRSLSSTS